MNPSPGVDWVPAVSVLRWTRVRRPRRLRLFFVSRRAGAAGPGVPSRSATWGQARYALRQLRSWRTRPAKRSPEPARARNAMPRAADRRRPLALDERRCRTGARRARPRSAPGRSGVLLPLLRTTAPACAVSSGHRNREPPCCSSGSSSTGRRAARSGRFGHGDVPMGGGPARSGALEAEEARSRPRSPRIPRRRCRVGAGPPLPRPAGLDGRVEGDLANSWSSRRASAGLAYQAVVRLGMGQAQRRRHAPRAVARPIRLIDAYAYLAVDNVAGWGARGTRTRPSRKRRSCFRSCRRSCGRCSRSRSVKQT